MIGLERGGACVEIYIRMPLDNIHMTSLYFGKVNLGPRRFDTVQRAPVGEH